MDHVVYKATALTGEERWLARLRRRALGEQDHEVLFQAERRSEGTAMSVSPLGKSGPHSVQGKIQLCSWLLLGSGSGAIQHQASRQPQTHGFP